VLDNPSSFPQWILIPPSPLYHCISCGLSPLRRLNVLPRYSMRCGSFLMVANSALSTAFWSLARADVTFFFYIIPKSAPIYCPDSSLLEEVDYTDLRLLALLKELLLPMLLCWLIPCEISFFCDLLHHLIIYPFQLHLHTRSDDISRINSS